MPRNDGREPQVESLVLATTNVIMRAMITTSLAALALAAVAGCASSAPPAYRSTTYSREIASYDVRELELQASEIMGCPTRALAARAVTDRVWRVTGCGQAREFAWVDLGEGRGTWDPIPPVSSYASNELACPLDAIVVQAPADNVRRVSGCGERATYQLACDARTCAWTMTEREEVPPPRPSVTIIPPPSGARPGPYATRPSAAPPPQPYPPGTVIVVPEGGHRPDPAVEQAIRAGIDARRTQVLACSGSQPIMIRARWGADGRVWLTLDRPYARTAVEQCVRDTVGGFQVTNEAPGEVIHLVR